MSLTESAELTAFAAKLAGLRTPEDLFGVIRDQRNEPAARPVQLDNVKRLYKRFARVCHVDRHTVADQPLAQSTFATLGGLYQDALARIANGRYGSAAATTDTVIKTKRATYTVARGLATGDLATIYRATSTVDGDVLLKIARTTGSNDLLDQEVATVTRLQKAASKTGAVRHFLPVLHESFILGSTARRASVFAWQNGYVPLPDVVAEFPEGLDGRHFVWIFNRLMTVLGYAHEVGVVHGAVLPTHVLIQPDTHAILLIDWAFAVPVGERVKAISAGYRGWYPREVLNKAPVSGATDIYMAARCMSYLLGADDPHDIPRAVPAPFKRFLQSCCIVSQARRPQDAWELLDGFGVMAKDVYGPRKFVPLVLSSKGA